MPTTITVPDGYGYVALISLGGIPLFSWLHGLVVTIIRSKSGVHYPYHYATPEQVKNNPTAYRLNCAQRAHGQLLENMPQTMLMMLLAGLRYPIATRWLGLAWMGLRTAYWLGYVYSSKTKGAGRFYGGPFWFVQGLIWTLGIGSAITMI